MNASGWSSLGPEHIWEGAGVIGRVGEEVRRFSDRVLIVVDDNGWPKVYQAVEESLRRAGVAFCIHPFKGYCSQNNVEQIVQKARGFDAGVILGVGGGRVMDTAKSVSAALKCRVITLPTCAATCAAYVQLCVWYDDQGRSRPGITIPEAVAAMIADTDVLVSTCPPRLLASGIADALAKYPELEYNVRLFPLPGCTENFYVALSVAQRCYEFLMKSGPAALNDMLKGTNSEIVRETVRSVITMTGLASALVAGVKQLAVAHMFYSGVATLWRHTRDMYLHGEIVSCGIPLQMAANGRSELEIRHMINLLSGIGTPVCLSELEIEPMEGNRTLLLDHIHENGFDDPVVFERIQRGFALIYR